MERRTWKRRQKTIPCIIEAPDFLKDEQFECMTQDISLGGAFLARCNRIPTDRIVELKFTSDVTNHNHHYSLFGYIIRKNEQGSAFAIRRASKLSLYRLNEMIDN